MSKKKIKLKEFFPSNLALKNSTSVYLMVILLAIVGTVSYITMPKESFPELKQPTIYINTPYFGNSPADIENLVTRPIEKQLKSLKGVNKLKSYSKQDFSIIIVEFDLDIAADKALQDTKDAVDKAKSDLPNDLDAEPNIFELDFSEFPIMNVNIYGNLPDNEMKENAEYLQDEIEGLPEISEAPISGLLDNEVKVSVDMFKMEALLVSFHDIENAIKNENISMSGGEVKTITGQGAGRRSLRVEGEFKNWREIGNIIVKHENQEIVYLKDIADISFGAVEPTSFARLNGQKVLTLDIKKRSGQNLIAAADKIKDLVAKAKEKKFPDGLEVTITNDQSLHTKNIVANLENSIIMAVLLVVFVLMLFLGLRSAMFVGIAIPLSMFLGIAILNAFGYTLNMIILFSLILALGMLVDNSIVVVENIYRWRTDLTKSNRKASKFGVGEVAIPIIGSTVTTLAAFIPLLFWKDIIGEFMKLLPITLIIVLSASVFVALVVNPVITQRFMKIENDKASAPKKFWLRTIALIVIGILLKVAATSMGYQGLSVWGGVFLFAAMFSLFYRFVLLRVIDYFKEKLMVKVENGYSHIIDIALSKRNPVWIFLGIIVLMIVSYTIFGLSKPRVLFFPENEPSTVSLFIDAPLGTDIETTNKITLELEQKVRKALEGNMNIVEAILAQVGEKTADPSDGPQAGSSPNKARITVSFIEADKRVFISKVSTKFLMEKIRESVSSYTAASVTVAKDRQGPPVGKPINLEIKGEDYSKLIVLVEKVKKVMEDADVPGVDKLKTDLELDKPELLIRVNRDAASRFGISTGQIAMALRTALLGKEASKYKEGEDDYPIEVRLKDEYRYNLSSLLNLKITFRNFKGQMVQVPVSTVCSIEYTSSYGTIKRLGMERVVTIFSEVKDGYSPTDIVNKYKQILKTIPMETGFSYKFTGEMDKQNESASFMMQAMMFAVFLIFLIIVTQFNSIIYPLVIMVTVVFSTIGVFLGFGLAGMDFVILMCGIGIISLAGVVVNNGILLIDYTNLLKSNRKAELGLKKDEPLPVSEVPSILARAGKTRLRPVLLTAITTILGIVPMAIGMNIDFVSLLNNFDPQFFIGGDSANFWGPMAWTVIFGLTFATFLTLIAVPVMVLLVDKIVARLKK